MAPEGDYSLGPAVDSTGRPLILAGWNGHALLLRRLEPAQSQAALLTPASKSDVADFLGSPKPPTIGHPQLFVTEIGSWPSGSKRSGTSKEPSRGLEKADSGTCRAVSPAWSGAMSRSLRSPCARRRDCSARISATGRTAIAEALAADERGETLAAMERFVWLIEARATWVASWNPRVPASRQPGFNSDFETATPRFANVCGRSRRNGRSSSLPIHHRQACWPKRSDRRRGSIGPGR